MIVFLSSRNLVTAADFQVQQPNETEQDRIETIAEGDEEDEEEEEEEEEDEEGQVLHENPSHYVVRESTFGEKNQTLILISYDVFRTVAA